MKDISIENLHRALGVQNNHLKDKPLSFWAVEITDIAKEGVKNCKVKLNHIFGYNLSEQQQELLVVDLKESMEDLVVEGLVDSDLKTYIVATPSELHGQEALLYILPYDNSMHSSMTATIALES